MLDKEKLEKVYYGRCMSYLDYETAKLVAETLGYRVLGKICEAICRAYDDGWNAGILVSEVGEGIDKVLGKYMP